MITVITSVCKQTCYS